MQQELISTKVRSEAKEELKSSFVIKNLTLQNFKGIKAFTLKIDGQDCDIFGENATGKSTIADGFFWLLFGKDSQNQAQFEIKTLDQNGEPLHGLEHSVEGVFTLKGQELILKKIYKEVWTKKRGSAQKEFSGHTTEFFIQGVPTQKKEYDAKIAEIVGDENLFKLLTNVRFFNEVLSWQDRRKLLLEVCGDISDRDVIASDESLSRLPEILGSRTLDNHRKVIAARRTEINKELEKIPVRIDEATKSLASLEDFSEGTLKGQIEEQRNLLKLKEQTLSRIQSGGEIAERTKELREVEAKILELQNATTKKDQEATDAKLKELRTQKNTLEYQVESLEKDKKGALYDIEKVEKKMAQLREAWFKENEKQFEIAMNCPTCERPLPEEQIEAARANFNNNKAETLAENQKDGLACKLAKEKLQESLGIFDKKIDSFRNALVPIEKEITALSQEPEKPAFNLELHNLIKRKHAIEADINSLKETNETVIARLREEIKTIEETILPLQKQLASFDQYKRGLERIEQLKGQERLLAREFEKLEAELNLTDLFIKTKVNLLTEKINSKFKIAKFRLFETQINEGVREVCEVAYKGVGYSDLNQGMRVNIGLDVLSTLQNHYGFYCPVIIDQAESITKLIDMDCQMIRLIVSAKDQKLRIEISE